MNFGKNILASTWIVLGATAASAEDSYYHLPVISLTLVEGTLPERSTPGDVRRWQMLPAFQPYAVLDGEGEVYVGVENLQPWDTRNRSYEDSVVAMRAPQGKDVSGRLFVPKPDLSGMAVLKFTVPAARAKAESRGEFLKAKESHYRRLLERNLQTPVMTLFGLEKFPSGLR